MNPRERFLSSLIETDALEGFVLEGADPTELYVRCQRSAAYIVPVEPSEGGAEAFRSKVAILAQAAWDRVQTAFRKANPWPGIEEDLICKACLPGEGCLGENGSDEDRMPRRAQPILDIAWPSHSGMALVDRYYLSANRGVWRLWVKEADPEPLEPKAESFSAPRVVAVLAEKRLTERSAALHLLIAALRQFEKEYAMYGYEEAMPMGCLDEPDLDALDWLVWRQAEIAPSRCSRSFHEAVDEAWAERTNSIEA